MTYIILYRQGRDKLPLGVGVDFALFKVAEGAHLRILHPDAADSRAPEAFPFSFEVVDSALRELSQDPLTVDDRTALGRFWTRREVVRPIDFTALSVGYILQRRD